MNYCINCGKEIKFKISYCMNCRIYLNQINLTHFSYFILINYILSILIYNMMYSYILTNQYLYNINYI